MNQKIQKKRKIKNEKWSTIRNKKNRKTEKKNER